MQIMLPRQVWDIVIRLSLKTGKRQFAWQQIDPNCFYTNLEYSKKMRQATFIICRLKIRCLSLCVAFMLFALPSHDSPTGKMLCFFLLLFVFTVRRQGKVIKQKAVTTILPFDNTSKWYLHTGQYNPFLSPHFTHNENN